MGAIYFLNKCSNNMATKSEYENFYEIKMAT